MNNELFEGTVPANNELFQSTVPVNNFFLFIQKQILFPQVLKIFLATNLFFLTGFLKTRIVIVDEELQVSDPSSIEAIVESDDTNDDSSTLVWAMDVAYSSLLYETAL